MFSDQISMFSDKLEHLADKLERPTGKISSLLALHGIPAVVGGRHAEALAEAGAEVGAAAETAFAGDFAETHAGLASLALRVCASRGQNRHCHKGNKD